MSDIQIDSESHRLTVDTKPIVEIRDYVTAYGYGVTARFDFTGIPAEHHHIMLMMIQQGGCHLAKPCTGDRKPETPRRWWHRFIPNKTKP